MANSYTQFTKVARGMKVLAVSALAFAGLGLAPARTTIYVATNGNDAWSGRSTALSAPDGPKRSIVAALAEVRSLRSRGLLASDGAEIVVRPGIYNLREANITLNTADSGTEGAPLIIKSEISGGAILDGAQRLTRWMPLGSRGDAAKIDRAARPFVFCAPLNTNVFPNLGHLSAWNSENSEAENFQPTQPEVFDGSRRLTLARYPNTGYARMTSISPQNTHQNPAIMATMPGLKTPANASDIWFVGMHKTKFFAEVMEKVSSLNPTTGEVILELTGEYRNHPTRHPENTYPDNHPNAAGRFALVNSLYELDSPGEYYIDRTKRLLYVWPLVRENRREIAISLMQAPFFAINDASHVQIEGFVLQRTRHDGVMVTNGRNITLNNLTITNVGNAGVRVLGGNTVRVTNCTISDTGGTGIHMEGGDRALLIPANHVVDRCDIRRTARVVRMGRPMVRLKGVGMTLSNTRMQESDHLAVWFSGNDIKVQNNHIKDVCLDSSDSAAIYTNHQWTSFGNEVTGNFVENVQRRIESQYTNIGVYLDGAASGVTVRGNVFKNVMLGVDVLGGNYNTVTGNVFYQNNASIKINDVITNDLSTYNRLMAEANTVPWMNSVWQERFPELFALMMDQDSRARRYPQGNVISGNISLKGLDPRVISPVWYNTPFQVWNELGNEPERNTISTNVDTQDESQFVNPSANDFRLRPGSSFAQMGVGLPSTVTVGIPDSQNVGSQIVASFQMWRP